MFATSDDLRSLLAEQFRHVRVKQQEYPLQSSSWKRVEGYWRCSDADGRLEELDWK